MKDKLNSQIEQTEIHDSNYTPTLFRLSKQDDKVNLDSLLKSNPTVLVTDQITGQVEEFVKSSHPKKVFTATELKAAALAHIGSTPAEEYGVWVYYPWSNRLVHILDEEEFVAVRTNRNTYKITPEEKSFLSAKKIGIIGLSVGQSIALTIAMERICGELRLADFDLLEMSNLNRIRAGVHNLGLKKTIVAAREIMEIDPYLKVTCYHDGLTENNVDDFFLKNGKLDVCIEVCDGLYAKIFSRLKAKEHRVAVVMNSSDRGTTDIERYDLDPGQPVLHGLIDHLDLTKVKEAKTNEEKVPYLLPMLGVTTSTNRLRASMLEIQETITTWPQLASGVILGGGICADVCRRVMLGQINKSGRYFVDLEDLINDNVTSYTNTVDLKKNELVIIPNTGIEDYRNELIQFENTFAENITAPLKAGDIELIVTAAISAPSGGNIQPWKWIYRNNRLFLFEDRNRSRSILNFKQSASHMAFGAASENVFLISHTLGLEVNCQEFPLGSEAKLVAVFTFGRGAGTTRQPDLTLASFIPKRLTNRNMSDRKVISEQLLDTLKKSIEKVPGATVTFFTGDNELNRFKEILCEVDRLYLTSKAGNMAFNGELRWTREEAEKTRDGIDIDTMDITPTELAGLTVSKEWSVTSYMREWGTGNAFSKITAKSINSAGALGLISLPANKDNIFFDGGRALQLLWLTSTSIGLAFQPMSVCLFLFNRITQGNFDGLEEIKDELLILHKRFADLCSIIPDHKEIFFFRLSNAGEPKVKSLRRPLEDVFIHE